MTKPSPDLMVDVVVRIAASAEDVWHAIIDSDTRRAWWSYLELHPFVGGELVERWTDETGQQVTTRGTVLELAPFRLLRLSWRDAGWLRATEVRIRLTPAREGTWVRVQHDGLDQLPAGPQLVTEHRSGWRAHLNNLRRAVELQQ